MLSVLKTDGYQSIFICQFGAGNFFAFKRLKKINHIAFFGRTIKIQKHGRLSRIRTEYQP